MSNSSTPAKLTCNTRIGNFVRRQRHLQNTQDRDIARRNLDDHAQRQTHQRRRSPAQLGHRADQENSLLRREDGTQVADDARRIGDHVLREHDALDRTGLHAVHQWLEENGAVQPEQTAHGEQREAETKLNAGAEVRGDDNQQREAAGAIGHLRGDESDGGNREEAGDLELQCAGVLSAVGVDVEIAAAAYDAGVQ